MHDWIYEVSPIIISLTFVIALFFYFVTLSKQSGLARHGLEVRYAACILMTLGFVEFKDNIPIVLELLFEGGELNLITLLLNVGFFGLSILAAFILCKATRAESGDKTPERQMLVWNGFIYAVCASYQLLIVNHELISLLIDEGFAGFSEFYHILTLTLTYAGIATACFLLARKLRKQEATI